MVTTFEDSSTKDSVLLLVFCGQKDTMQRVFIKKCFMIIVGSVYGVKRLITGLRISLKDVGKVASG
jgi:hypothetical protein